MCGSARTRCAAAAAAAAAVGLFVVGGGGVGAGVGCNTDAGVADTSAVVVVALIYPFCSSGCFLFINTPLGTREKPQRD